MKPDPIYTALTAVTGGRHPGSGARQDSDLPRAPKGKLKYGAAGPSHWSTFWRDFGVENQPHERCYIPGDGRHVVDRHWAHFTESLPRGAQVIDLGCGAGILGCILLSHRGDLCVTGVDFAKVPAIARANLTVHPWVGMEALPFGNGCFDAAVSLFGIEYGNMDETARELGRVLKPGARFGFLVHHHESEIVREGGTRRRGLRDLLSGKMKTAFLAGDLAGFDQQAIWQKLADDLDPELTLTMQMERSAKSIVQMGSWLVPLLSIMSAVNVSVLRRASGEPIAWDVNGYR
jgi:SAM-dependent methyltransferase